MKKNMTSKERIMAAIKKQDVDYIPCVIYFNPNMIKYGFNSSNLEESINFHLKYELDTFVSLPFIENKIHPDVRTRTWIEDVQGEKHPILFKEYITPEGTLRRGIRYTDDWPYGHDIPMPGTDFTCSNNYEQLIKNPEDIKAYKYLRMPLTENDLDIVEQKVMNTKIIADKYQLPTIGLAGEGLASLLFFMGAQNTVYFALDYPEAFSELAKIESDITISRINLLSSVGVDLLKKFGGYEQTNFFSYDIFKDVVYPLLKREVEYAKSKSTAIFYRVVTGMKPLLGLIADIGFDCVEGFEPCLSDCTNMDIYNALGGKSCIWTGVSSAGHIGSQEGDAPVRKAVRDAVEVFGKNGFILGVTNSIRVHWPWSNTLAMIDEWKKVR